MKEELTTLMHSEFTIKPETEIKHAVWGFLSACDHSGTTIEEELKNMWNVTREQIEKYKDSYRILKRNFPVNRKWE